MLYAWSIEQITDNLRERYLEGDSFKDELTVAFIGILLARPEQEITAQEILPSLDYFHHRSGEDIDFYCIGYGRYWPEDGITYNDAVEVAKDPNGGNSHWKFSPKAFSVFIRDLEYHTSWKYSGGVELLLLNANNGEDNEGYFDLDFRRVVSIDLASAIRDKVIVDVHHLFEDVFRFARTRRRRMGVVELSDQLGVRAFLKGALDTILELVPQSISSTIRKAPYLAVQDYSPHNF